MTIFRTATIDTPDGPFTVIEDADGTVIAAGWDADAGRLFARSRLEGEHEFVEGARAVSAVAAYYDGDLEAPLSVPAVQRGTPLQEALWAHLRGIPAGRPQSYSEAAQAIGSPRAARAVASSCARNANGLFVPCHRIVPAGGGVTGFAWGPDVKLSLLARESGAAA